MAEYEQTKSYDPTQVSVIIQATVNGQQYSHVITGVSEETIISIERQNDPWSNYNGAYGDTTRIYNPNHLKSNIRIPLQQTSNSNDVLDALYERDVDGRTSDTLFSLTIKDAAGRSVHYASEAWVSVKPEVMYGNAMNTREWVLQVNYLEDHIAGNGKVNQSTANVIRAFGGEIEDSFITNA